MLQVTKAATNEYLDNSINIFFFLKIHKILHLAIWKNTNVENLIYTDYVVY